MDAIGERIKEARQERGLSQEELAQIINSTKSAISRYESGKRQPRLDQLQRIANALNVTVGFLQGYESMDSKQIIDALKRKDVREFERLMGLNLGSVVNIGQEFEEEAKKDEDDFEEGLKKVSDAARSALEPPKIAETKEQLLNILEELSYEELETLVKFAQFTKYQRQEAQEATQEPTEAPQPLPGVQAPPGEAGGGGGRMR